LGEIVTYGVTGVNTEEAFCGLKFRLVGETQKVVDIFIKEHET
jgi:hypothetical protein